jgi:plastocyanin
MKLRIPSVLLCLVGILYSTPSFSTHWQAKVGAQSNDMGHQAMAFLPNEIWIHAGDAITWTFDVNEIHTVTFLISGENRPPFPVGCPPGPPPGITPNGASVDGLHCVNAGAQVAGQHYTARFPVAGNFKLVCLVHEDMTGVVHVLAPGIPLPHNQAYYDRQGLQVKRALLADGDRASDASDRSPPNHVVAGTGEVAATPGGHVNLAVMRFSDHVTYIRAGQTVQWNNEDPSTPHTITFGTEPINPIPPSTNVGTDLDGARHATIRSTADSVHSGFIVAEPQERVGLPQAPPGITRFRVTFTHAGIYPYICALHDNLGMHGEVIVSN